MFYDIDFANLLVRYDMLDRLQSLELCALNFNTPIAIGEKTPSTSFGLDDVFQLTARPYNFMVESKFHAPLVAALLSMRVAVVQAAKSDVPAGPPRKGTTFTAFCRISQRVSGPSLARALERVGAVTVRFVQIGDKMPVADFREFVLPHVVNSRNVFDLACMHAAPIDEIPLAYVRRSNTDAAKKRTETLNALGELGIYKHGPSGSVRIRNDATTRNNTNVEFKLGLGA